MREIKFRAWDKKNKCWQSLKVASLLMSGDSNSVELHSNSLELMQYTGLIDKRGVEIFEGDIVSYIGHYAGGKPINLQVKWDDNNCFWRGMFSETQGHHLDNFHNNDFEVIGNIYSNPELLTKEAA